MTTSQSAILSEPTGSTKISAGTLGYIRGRHRQRQFDLVIREFKQSGISQRELADRLGKAPEVVSRLLARPQNWESDTFSDLLFAVSGAVAAYRADHPFRYQPSRIISFANISSRRQEDIKPDPVELGLLPKSPPTLKASEADFVRQLIGRVA
jgi:transcriptional regulator with XRE-family HTH domain